MARFSRYNNGEGQEKLRGSVQERSGDSCRSITSDFASWACGNQLQALFLIYGVPDNDLKFIVNTVFTFFPESEQVFMFRNTSILKIACFWL